ncbi:MAG: hypothetical protein KDI74_04145 [Gammaproteobacteria bacterium]|nr:hypothetical protein [Gammaproteobacteria bacterium]HXK55347.1 hypothetical protein [Gammaproteobacteria bacterium]
MKKHYFYLVLLVLLWTMAVDPLMANKFETISGGVNGLSQEKIRLLKEISLYTGGFLLMLSVIALITRKRFEGFIGYSSRNDSSATLKGAAILAVAGTIFIGLGFL